MEGLRSDRAGSNAKYGCSWADRQPGLFWSAGKERKVARIAARVVRRTLIIAAILQNKLSEVCGRFLSF
jgi:hypothetical protein